MRTANTSRQLPESPGVYLFRMPVGQFFTFGKARNLRSRVRSYFLESRWIDAKTGSAGARDRPIWKPSWLQRARIALG